MPGIAPLMNVYSKGDTQSLRVINMYGMHNDVINVYVMHYNVINMYVMHNNVI